jgi:hypothetical protein
MTIFNVQAVVTVRVTRQMESESLEDAVAKARNLRVPDFVRPVNDAGWFDTWDAFRITGVSE